MTAVTAICWKVMREINGRLYSATITDMSARLLEEGGLDYIIRDSGICYVRYEVGKPARSPETTPLFVFASRPLAEKYMSKAEGPKMFFKLGRGIGKNIFLPRSAEDSHEHWMIGSFPEGTFLTYEFTLQEVV